MPDQSNVGSSELFPAMPVENRVEKRKDKPTQLNLKLLASKINAFL
jgi:hypothetical protein